MRRPDWAPPEVDITKPSIARVYDYYLGGSHNFAADRDAARQTLRMLPGGQQSVWELRHFLRRAVTFLVGEGVTQFLDIGSGIPTVGNVHEIAQAADPGASVVYVDVDPVAVAHSRVILRANHRAAVVHADLRDPQRILDHPYTRRLLDLDEPVALLMCAVLHFVPDADDPVGLIRRYHDALPSGSYLAITHGSDDHPATRRQLDGLKAIYDRTVATSAMRSKAETEALFGGFELVEPGVVWVSDWRPEPEAEPPDLLTFYGGVGRKR